MVKTTGGWRALLGSAAGIAVAMAVMNVGTYSFQMAAARLLGPKQYGAIASLMALMLMVGVVQLGLQATAARRISAEPQHVAQIEREIMRVTYRMALGLAALLIVLSPVVNIVLKLNSLPTALMVAVASLPLTIMGGQAGILQGERRWLPLAVLYISVGIPRVIIGALFMMASPTAISGMIAVAVGLTLPVMVGYYSLRRKRAPGDHSEAHKKGSLIRETAHNSQALLAFFVLSNADILVARNILDEHDAGLYAAGLILAKAVLFLPQFVVVVAFPSMSNTDERRSALYRSLALVSVIGAVSMVGSIVLSNVAMIFVGGDAYGEIENELWLFAILGTLMAMLQLLVYAVLARQGRKAVYLIWISVLALIGGGLWITDTRDSLLLMIIGIDAILFALLLVISLYRMRDPDQAPA